MCGVIGLIVKKDQQIEISKMIITGLTMLQHRGQDACGISVCDENRTLVHKDNGLISVVFPQGYCPGFDGTQGVGHCRYPTAGTPTSREAQPFYTNYPYGISLAHNGNIINADDLRDELVANLRSISTLSDSEVVTNIFAEELVKRIDLSHKNNRGVPIPTPQMIFDAVDALHARVKGGYAVCASIQGVGLVLFRDPYGIRPLIYGKYVDSNGITTAYCGASESAALEALDMQIERDVLNGETIFIDTDLNVYIDTQRKMAKTLSPCIFEYVYIARPDSIIDNISVYNARIRIGKCIAKRLIESGLNEEIDIVACVPDTSRHTAIQVAESLHKPFAEAIYKNRYVARTFIMPGQSMRQSSVKLKHMPIHECVQGKNVLLIDDSIVRGNTSKVVIQIMRDNGAKKVFFCSSSPPVKYRNIYGIDMPTQEELIAHNRTLEQITEAMGCDKVIYPTLEELIQSCTDETMFGPTPTTFDCSCFTGHYITGPVSDTYFEDLKARRSDEGKKKVLNTV